MTHSVCKTGGDVLRAHANVLNFAFDYSWFLYLLLITYPFMFTQLLLYVPSEAAEVEDEESEKLCDIVYFFLVIVQTVYSYNNIS